nr:PREDICTED: integrin alpha-X-like [Latimeria chalumnae]|eukprot:XP_014353912.1 PREDICTED: integrin alpha-X-like [Latimeria chalumnae]
MNTFVNGICYLLDNHLSITRNLTPAYQECNTGVDIVILYDDSHSISDQDFKTMQKFMLNIIHSFRDANVLFAVVHFSTDVNIVFNFNTKKSRQPEVLEEYWHTKGQTHTPTAIRFAAEKVFTEEEGARKGAKKLLITITDGQSNDEKVTFEEATAAANKKNIIRYAIGVGNAFSEARAIEELEKIASNSSNIFRVGSFDALTSIQNQLKEKIFAIEGTEQSDTSTFQMEMSQGGFSTLLTQDALVFGAVGAYDWSGGLVESRGSTTSFINVSMTTANEKDAYLGYSVAAVKGQGEVFYAAGAPRYQHVGKVIVFHRNLSSHSWQPRQNIHGTQIGSYFGAELCSVDLNQDGVTDLLLIGAPMFHESGVGGKVYVCSMDTQIANCPDRHTGVNLTALRRVQAF